MAFVRKTAIFSSILVSLCFLLYIAAWSLVQTRYFQSWLETSLGNRGVDLRVAGLAPVFPFGLIVSSAEITVPGQLHFTSKEIRANLNPFSLMFGQLEELNLLEPSIRVQLTSSSKSGASSPINLLVRSFSVEDGRVEVETGNGKSIAIPRIELRGENLNLGSQSGELETTAFVPELNSDLKISLRASPAEIEASLELLQHKSPGTGAISQIEPKGQGQVTLHFEPDATLRLKGHAALQQVVVNGVRYTGAFDFLAQTDTHRETITAELQSELTQLAGLTLGTDITPTLPLSIRIKGQFTTTDNHLSLTQIRLHSPLGTVNGRAVVALDPKPRITSALFETQNFALSQLRALLPNGSPGNLDGLLTATLNVQGDLAPWSFSGILATTATNIVQSHARIGRLKGTIPFTLDAAQLAATGFELSAEKLDVNLPGQELTAGIASLGIKGDLRRAPKKAPRFNGTIDLRGGSFTTPDGLAAAESIGGKASIRLVMEPDGTSRAELNVQLDTMELLWNRFFADFKAQQPRLSLSARYDSRNETLQMENGRFSLSLIGDLEFGGRLERLGNNPVFDIRIQTPRWQLNKFYEFFIRETFTTSLPLLGELQLSGAAIAKTRVRGVPERFSVEGTLQLRGTKLIRPDRWSVGPLEFALPFKLDYPQRQRAAAPTQAPRAGIAVRRIQFGASEIPPLHAIRELMG